MLLPNNSTGTTSNKKTSTNGEGSELLPKEY
jgi:hypothetical protein